MLNYKNIFNTFKETIKKIYIKINNIYNKIFRFIRNKIFKKIVFNIGLRIYERLFSFKDNIKSVTTYNYGTINLEKEKKSLNNLNKIGNFFLNKISTTRFNYTEAEVQKLN